MKLIYAPPGEVPQEWGFDQEEMTGDQAILVEDTLGVTSLEWAAQLQKGSMKAMLALLWVLRREQEPDLVFADVTGIKVSYMTVVDDGDDETPDPKDDSVAAT